MQWKTRRGFAFIRSSQRATEVTARETIHEWVESGTVWRRWRLPTPEYIGLDNKNRCAPMHCRRRRTRPGEPAHHAGGRSAAGASSGHGRQCTEGEGAGRSLRSTPYLVLLDIRMPSGTEGLGPCWRSSPTPVSMVVFVTAFKDYALRAFHASAVDYVLKPIDPDELRGGG